MVGSNALLYSAQSPNLKPSLNPIKSDRDPTSSDIGYLLGQPWVNEVSEKIFFLAGESAGEAQWADGTFVGGFNVIQTNSGNAEPELGVIELLGTAAQGLSFSASGNTITGTIEDSTTAQKGISETATDPEAIAKASTTVLITPSNLDALDASTSFTGVVEYSNNQEFTLQTSTDTVITPSNYLAGQRSCNVTFTSSPIGQGEGGSAPPVNANNAQTNFWLCEDGLILGIYNIGNKTIIAPRMQSSGLSIGFDLTDTEGCEIGCGSNQANMAQFIYTVSSSNVFMEAEINVTTTTGLNFLMAGFRVSSGPQLAISSYTGYASLGLNPSIASNSVISATKRGVSPQSVQNINTGVAWTNGQTKKLRVEVFNDGTTSYYVDDVAVPVPPIIPFPTGSQVIRPFIRLVQNATTSTVFLKSLKVGYLQ